MDPGIEWKTRGIDPARTLRRKLGERAAKHKDDVARWKRDHPNVEPGSSFKKNTHKGWSKIRYTNESFRRGFDQVDWGHGDSGD